MVFYWSGKFEFNSWIVQQQFYREPPTIDKLSEKNSNTVRFEQWRWSVLWYVNVHFRSLADQDPIAIENQIIKTLPRTDVQHSNCLGLCKLKHLVTYSSWYCLAPGHRPAPGFVYRLEIYRLWYCLAPRDIMVLVLFRRYAGLGNF